MFGLLWRQRGDRSLVARPISTASFLNAGLAVALLFALSARAEPPPSQGVQVPTSGGQSDEWTQRRYDPADLWAYRPIESPTPPTNTGALHPIDAFLAAKLKQVGLVAAGPAEPRTLFRRAVFDLTGLPPTPAQLTAFLEDDRPDAYLRWIERLLVSPHYGEQAARHWLDVVRYADSDGFSNDHLRPHAWRYRDYVIRSFNQDKPFDRFIIEQLAGDELDAADPEMLIAVGFLRMGPFEHTAMSVQAVTRQQWLDDVTNAVGVTFLASGMSCCKCHDHKFDPLPTRDYYRLQAVFAPVQFADRPAPFLPVENTHHLTTGRARIAKLRKLKGVELVLPANATSEEKAEANLGLKKVAGKRQQHLAHEAELFRPFAFSLYNGPPHTYRSNQPFHPMPKHREGEVQRITILQGGSLEAPTQTVGPGALSLVSTLAPATQKVASITSGRDGRRLALARWIASADNPLTARVIVNRIWQQHFGRGLAANPNNFGKMGARPSHPALLDYLATWFVEHGWSIKRLHRFIMTSAAYQRSGRVVDPDHRAKVDPNHRLLAAYPGRRLAAEELRDAMLAVSGELNPALGGIPIRPEIHPEVAMQPRHVMGSVGLAYQPSPTPQQRHRRTIYALKIRTLRDPLLEVFDQPNPDISCERRDTAMITPQVFALFNSRSSRQRAVALAFDLTRQSMDSETQIRSLYQRMLQREPRSEELAACLDHLKVMTQYHQQHPAEQPTLPPFVHREMIEEMTGLKFRWQELLDIHQNHIPDRSDADLEPQTRALADICLVLYNSHAFVNVD